jgi:hypothetical protein
LPQKGAYLNRKVVLGVSIFCFSLVVILGVVILSYSTVPKKQGMLMIRSFVIVLFLLCAYLNFLGQGDKALVENYIPSNVSLALTIPCTYPCYPFMCFFFFTFYSHLLTSYSHLIHILFTLYSHHIHTFHCSFVFHSYFIHISFVFHSYFTHISFVFHLYSFVFYLCFICGSFIFPSYFIHSFIFHSNISIISNANGHP